MSGKWTKGPWMVTNGVDIYPVGDTGGRKHIAHCDPDDAPMDGHAASEVTDLTYSEVKANARLIAGAPKLAEALVFARQFVVLCAEQELNGARNTLEFVDAALEKAGWEG